MLWSLEDVTKPFHVNLFDVQKKMYIDYLLCGLFAGVSRTKHEFRGREQDHIRYITAGQNLAGAGMKNSSRPGLYFTVPNIQVFVWRCSCEDHCHTTACFIDHPRINDYMSAESIQKSWMEEPLSDLPMSDSLSFSPPLSPHTSPHKLDRKHWFLKP